MEGLLIDPVYYRAQALAGLAACVADGRVSKGSPTLFLHTGGLPALFGYERDLRAQIAQPMHWRC